MDFDKNNKGLCPLDFNEVITIKTSRILNVLLIIFFTCTLAACSRGKEDAVRDMVSPQQKSYNIYVFWDGRQSDYSELIEEMLNVINSEAILESLPIHNMSFISLDDQTQKYDYKKLFAIEQSPTIIVLDHEGIVLQTNDPNDIYDIPKN
ncbi:hypothetical protein CHH75_13865 [Paenibacillus sp. 7541]|nr:hypothetical protein CHH75_13865 [Paenibacillus sp. 7541]